MATIGFRLSGCRSWLCVAGVSCSKKTKNKNKTRKWLWLEITLVASCSLDSLATHSWCTVLWVLVKTAFRSLKYILLFVLSDVGVCCCMHNYSVARQTNEQWSKQNSLCDCQRAIVLFFVNFHDAQRWGWKVEKWRKREQNSQDCVSFCSKFYCLMLNYACLFVTFPAQVLNIFSDKTISMVRTVNLRKHFYSKSIPYSPYKETWVTTSVKWFCWH